MKLALGIMSGTSCDGVSIALAGFTGRSFKLLHETTFPYPPKLKQTLLNGNALTAPEISRLNVELGIYFADCTLKFLKKWNINCADVRTIGSHGHTLFHAGGDDPAHTLQIGEASYVAEKAGIAVVSDFRMRDLAAGGEGAPLIPYFDQFFFGGGKPKALQNIGGIANVTVVGNGVTPFAFDTGPGNCLIDLTVQKMTRGRQPYDTSGKIAAQGKIDQTAVKQMLKHIYFQKKPPKSTGRELFNEHFIRHYLKGKRRLEDTVATLTYFTAASIHQSYQKFLPGRLSEILVSGGGALNLFLMAHLKQLFAPLSVRSFEESGLPAQAKEPVAFAFFALQAIERKINHLPEGTGAKGARILGKIIPASPSRVGAGLVPARQQHGHPQGAPLHTNVPRKTPQLLIPFK
jgi:anhydro-N-acetylmuramic acid kinase